MTPVEGGRPPVEGPGEDGEGKVEERGVGGKPWREVRGGRGYQAPNCPAQLCSLP